MEFLSESNVPQYYKDITGVVCKFCGSPYVVNETRTTVKCGNPRCPRKIAGSMKAIIDKTGIKGYGIETCLKIVYSKQYSNITDLFIRPPTELDEPLTALIETTLRVADAVQLLSIPEFGENANRLFSKYNTMEEFLTIYDKEGFVDFEVQDAFGIGKLSENIIEILNGCMDDLFVLDAIFGFDPELTSHINKEVYICVTGTVNSPYLRSRGVYLSKRDELIKFLNEHFNADGFRFILKKSVTSEVTFVVCDNDSNTTKVKEGAARGILTTTDKMLASIVSFINKERGTMHE